MAKFYWIPLVRFFGLASSFFVLTSCLSQPRKPASELEENAKKSRFGIQLHALHELNQQLRSDSKACEIPLRETNESVLKNLDPSGWDVEEIRTRGQKLLQEFFALRLLLHDRLPDLSEICKRQVRELFVNLRSQEDFIGLMHYRDVQIDGSNIDFFKEPVPLKEIKAYHPYHLAPKWRGDFQFQNGDILITRGVSYTSSTISQLPTQPSLFSHIVLVHVEAGTGKTETIESYVGKGIDFYPINIALQNENVRILVLRAKDQVVAGAAANYMYDLVKSVKKTGNTIPYDYELDFENHDRMSCEEVAYVAYAHASQGQFKIPEVPSKISFVHEEFLRSLGLKNGDLMMPGDMETDSRFDIVLDWTDYRFMRESARKDAVSAEMFRWMNQLGYELKLSLQSLVGGTVWTFRNIPFLGPALLSMPRVPESLRQFRKDVPTKIVTTIANVNWIGDDLYKVVKKSDEDYFAKNNLWLTRAALRAQLETYRSADMEVYQKKSGPALLTRHFRPPTKR